MTSVPPPPGSTTSIRLLGVPEIVVAGEPVPGPRGRKTWAVLAYLLLVDDRPTRARLATLVHPDADDPRTALRWTLADLRRLLAGLTGPVGAGTEAVGVEGDPVTLTLPPGTDVDVRQVLHGGADAVPAGLRGQLLEGMTFRSSEPLERWLAAERHRLSMTAVDLLTAAARQAHTDGEAARAADLVARIVALDPYARPDR